MRWIFRIVFAVIALVVLAVAVLFLLPAERIAALVTGQFEAATGRAMTLEGDVRPMLWPELGVATGSVTIANADWSDAGPMLKAQRLSIGVDMGALFGGKIRIRRIEADTPQILLEVAADGRTNWQMSAAGPADDSNAAGDTAAEGTAVAAGGIPTFTLDSAVISAGSVSFVDHRAGSRTDLTGIDATLKLPDFNGAAEISLAATMNGQAFALDAGIAAFAAFLADGAVGANANLKVGGTSIAFDGRAGLSPLAAGGRVNADLADMAALFALIGQPAPVIPRGFGQSIGLIGDITATDAGLVTLRNGTIRLDQNTFTGDADLALAGRPKITARLSAGALDFSAAAPATGPGATAATETSAGWPRDPIDVSPLHAADAEIALIAPSIDLGVAKLGKSHVVARLDNGRAVAEIRELQAYGGSIAGSVIVNGRGGLSSRINLTAKGVALQPLLHELAGYDRLLASGDVAVNILGVGDNMQALMDSLSGEGSVNIGGGELRGLDLVGMLRNLDTSYVGEGSKTIFDSITASFTVATGVLSNDDLALKAPLLTASGAGTVGIGAQTLDYRAVPTLLESQTGGVLKVPLLIDGPWAAPRFRLDLEALAREHLGDAADRLKAEAEALAREKLQSEFGVSVDNATSVEDAVKTQIENRIGGGVLNLLGGGN